jgi:hypothetical protein
MIKKVIKLISIDVLYILYNFSLMFATWLLGCWPLFFIKDNTIAEIEVIDIILFPFILGMVEFLTIFCLYFYIKSKIREAKK